MKNKTKEVFFNNVAVYSRSGGELLVDFVDILGYLSLLPVQDRIIEFGNVRSICSVASFGNYWVINIQNLKNDELPLIADLANGSGETRLEVPDGKALSYRNIFVYRKVDNIICHIKPYGCPQGGKLRACINCILKNSTDFKDVRVDFGAIINRNYAEILKSAKKITSAKFVSVDNSGADIGELDRKIFGEYMSGRGIRRETKLSGVKGKNLKGALIGVIDSLISSADALNYLGITMTIDGKNVNFGRYLKTEYIDVDYLPDGKTIDFEKIAVKMSGLSCDF